MFFLVVDGFASGTHYLDLQCGPMPFARVAQHQILQSNLSSRASEALVHELALDTNFTAASLSQCVLPYSSQERLISQAILSVTGVIESTSPSRA